MIGDKFGITVGMHGAWQKRGSGHAYNSLTGHNFMVGGMSRLIVGLQVFSKKYKVCSVVQKKTMPPNRHRCPKNYPDENSAKSMEGYGAVRHCIELFQRTSEKAQAWGPHFGYR